MVLKNINFLKKTCRKAREKKLFWLWQRVDLNPGPCDPHSNALTTRLCRSQENGALQDGFLYHYYGWLSNNGLWGCQWPRRSLLTSNLNSVTSTPPISTAFQASTATISRISHGRISSVDLRPRTSSQVKGNGPIDSRAKVMMSDGNFLLWPKKHSIAGSWSCNKSCQKKKCAGGGAVNIPVPNFCQYCT